MAKNEMTLNDALIAIQAELKAPKSLKNKFGNFMYRNAETIYENVKPLLVKYGVSLRLTDDIVGVGDRTFLKSTAILSNGIDSVELSSLAELALEKKGMDAAQITGSASSYARKYALGGLFLLDDTQDIDGMDNKVTQQPKTQVTKKSVNADKATIDIIRKTFAKIGYRDKEISELVGGKPMNMLTTEDVMHLRGCYQSIMAETQPA